MRSTLRRKSKKVHRFFQVTFLKHFISVGYGFKINISKQNRNKLPSISVLSKYKEQSFAPASVNKILSSRNHPIREAEGQWPRSVCL